MLCALIMAGGKGERFWPLSTEEKPKQFLNLLGKDTMIQMTVKRLKELIPIERIFIVTAERYGHLVKEQLPEIPHGNIIVEPVGKNTAPCIALSALYIKKYYEDSTIVVLPSDHLITNEDNFRYIINEGYKFVNDNKDAIVTIGIEPNRPETGYGYIKYNELSLNSDTKSIKKVDAFVEKPSIEKAIHYINEGNYLWNAGMFIWKADTIIRLTERYLNNTYKILMEIALSLDDEYQETCNKKYSYVDNISVDYAIMEKYSDIYVIPGNFGWDDVGSWNAVERYSIKEKNNNVYKGKAISIDGGNNLVVSTSKPIVTLGLENIIIVESEDLILVASKEDINKIKEVKNSISF